MASFDLQKLARPNILKLVPYRCARDDFKEGVLLDANENTYGPSLTDLAEQEAQMELNRYPDPHQIELKQLFCDLRNGESSTDIPLTPENLFLGVGSDEAIDAVIRVLCAPGKDKLLTCPPTYGMYSVSAQINDVEVVKVDLTLEGPDRYQLRPDAVAEALEKDPSIKLVYITSPGNPTGSLVNQKDVEKLLEHPKLNCIIVVDEAYIDFAPAGSSMAPLVNKYPNLVVMQTLSKSFGLAAVRLGATFASKEMAQLLNNMKAPYNISTPTAEMAKRALSPAGVSMMQRFVQDVIEQRTRLVKALEQIPGVGGLVGGLDANFVLVQFLDKPNGKPSNAVALQLYEKLAKESSVVTRFRGKEPGCEGCVRISIGTADETTVVLREIEKVLQTIYSS